MKKSILALALLGALSAPAFANVVSCANPVLDGQTREYQTSGASDCVWGDGNIGGETGKDAFLLEYGTNDLAYGDLGPTFGEKWTLIDTQNAGAGGIQGSLAGLTVTNADNNSFDWLLTDTSFGQYALGLKDGGDPKWAVFLLSDVSGFAEILGSGSWSHVSLYGTNKVPEPDALALMGLGLLGLTTISRRRKNG